MPFRALVLKYLEEGTSALASALVFEFIFGCLDEEGDSNLSFLLTKVLLLLLLLPLLLLPMAVGLVELRDLPFNLPVPLLISLLLLILLSVLMLLLRLLVFVYLVPLLFTLSYVSMLPLVRVEHILPPIESRCLPSSSRPRENQRFRFFKTENVRKAFFILFAASCMMETFSNFLFSNLVLGLYWTFIMIQPKSGREVEEKKGYRR